MTYNTAPPERMLTVGEAAEHLGVSVETVRRWHRKGIITAQQVGTKGHRRIAVSEVQRLRTASDAA